MVRLAIGLGLETAASGLGAAGAALEAAGLGLGAAGVGLDEVVGAGGVALQAAKAMIAAHARSLTVFNGGHPPQLLSVCHKPCTGFHLQQEAAYHFPGATQEPLDLIW